MSEKKGPSVFRKILNVLFNIFWAIFGGIGMALSCIGNGIMTILMIIPIFSLSAVFGKPEAADSPVFFDHMLRFSLLVISSYSASVRILAQSP